MAINNIQKAYTAGEDALQNQWEVLFIFQGSKFDSKGAGFNGIPLRTKNLNIPEDIISTYVIHYNNESYERIKSKNESPKEFTFSLRLDKYFTIYKTLIDWRNVLNDYARQTTFPDDISRKSRIVIQVKALAVSSGIFTTTESVPVTWEFRGCFIKKIPEISRDYSSGDPVELEVTMGYLAKKEIFES